MVEEGEREPRGLLYVYLKNGRDRGRGGRWRRMNGVDSRYV